MKKLVLGLLALGLLGGLGLASWTAWLAEARHRTLVDAIVRHEDVRLLDADYRAGWLRSRAETSLELRGPVGEGYAERLSEAGVADVRARVGLHVRHAIEHGPLPLWHWLREGALGAPVLARVATRVELDNETGSELAPVLGSLPPLDLEVVLRATGRAEGRLRVAPGRLVWRPVPPEPEEKGGGASQAGAPALPEPLHIDWRGLTATFVAKESGSAAERLSARVELPGLALDRAGRATRASDVHARLELRGLSGGAPELLWSARLGSLALGAVGAEAQPGLLLEGWVASGRLELGSPLAGTLETEVASLRTPAASLGPARAELVLRAARPGPGPAAEARLRRLTLATPEGEIRGEGRLHLAAAPEEASAAAPAFAERLGGKLALSAPAHVADWLRVRSPALRRLLGAHAVPAAGGERVRARLRLEGGALRDAGPKTALRE